MTDKPLALIAEVTHRCPLRCVYCSNPLEMAKRDRELTTDQWADVFAQAGAMGMLHVHLTGGEPLVRADIVELVAAAHASGLYVNLITSGIGLTEQRLSALERAGLDHIQLSFQDSRSDEAAGISGVQTQEKKVEAARLIRSTRLALTINLVVHRRNLDRLEEMIAFAEGLGPQRIEIANVQYYGWAMKNRDLLMPTRAQVERSIEIVTRERARLATLEFVTPDYYGKFPKPCMGGWGRRLMLVDPAGRAMPCHSAPVIPNIHFDCVQERSLQWIWEESTAFNMFRGESWMQEPCSSCPRREQDFGGCRCQAFLMTGDASATDPVCSLSPKRASIDAVVENANAVKPEPAPPHTQFVYRVNPQYQ